MSNTCPCDAYQTELCAGCPLIPVRTTTKRQALQVWWNRNTSKRAWEMRFLIALGKVTKKLR